MSRRSASSSDAASGGGGATSNISPSTATALSALAMLHTATTSTAAAPAYHTTAAVRVQAAHPGPVAAPTAYAVPATTTTKRKAVAVPSNTTTGAVPTVTRKRPYRRTKRPAGYNDRSSVTTTTDTMLTSPVNAYDAVLAEIQDLLQAAAQAQQLGRLKMSSTYLLLLHARLVGLGKRFDKAKRSSCSSAGAENIHGTVGGGTTNTKTSSAPTDASLDTTNATATTNNNHEPSSSSVPHTHAPVSPPSNTRAVTVTTTTAASTVSSSAPAAIVLPANIELDTAMMEHLAKAAAELHARRSATHHTHSNHTASTPSGSLASPDARQFLAATTNHTGFLNAATETGVAPSFRLDHGTASGGTATATTRTTGTGTAGTTTTNVTGAATVAALVPGNHNNNNTIEEQQQQQLLLPPVRGRKPVTTAMNTVPNAVCNARELLRGASQTPPRAPP